MAKPFFHYNQPALLKTMRRKNSSRIGATYQNKQTNQTNNVYDFVKISIPILAKLALKSKNL